MTAILDSLTLATDSARRQALPPHIQLRQKLQDAIDHQLAALAKEVAGEAYTKTVERWVADPTTGERTRQKVVGKFRRWWWVDPSGKVCVEIRYANKALELKPGKRVIEAPSLEGLAMVLEQVKAAAAGGELDKALNAALALRRKELKGNKPKVA
ncbi:MAG: DUF6641 family protein [Rhodospirillaceae bacterium]